MLHIETLRLIKKTFRRFLSLSLIVMIGVGLMMGLMSSFLIMAQSVDRYSDEYHLQDLQIYSDYGFCKEDLFKIIEAENVKTFFASKMVDVKAKDINGDNLVIRVQELDRSINGFKLIAGRLPEKEGECLIIRNSDSKDSDFIGKHIIIDEKDNEDFLKNFDYKITGIVDTPEHLSLILGTSNYRNNELDSVIYVPNTNFISKYYTTVYLTLKQDEDLISFTNKYDDFIADNKKEIEDIAYGQQGYLRKILYEEYSAELKKNEELFNQSKLEGQKQLDDAKKQLDDANIMITTYEAQLSLLESTISSMASLIEANKDKVDVLYERFSFIEDNINKVLEILGRDKISYGTSSIDALREIYYSSISKFQGISWQLDYARNEYEKGLKEYNEGLLTYNKQIEEAENELKKARQDLELLPNAKWTILDRDQLYSSYLFKSSCNQMKSIGYSLPVLFFLVGALVCITTMKRLIDEQRGQIGIFVALGYSSSQIIMKYVMYALIASLAGGLIGIVLGQNIFARVIYEAWRLYYNLPEIMFNYPLNYVLLSLSSFSFLMCILTALICKNAISESPASLMRPKAPKNTRQLFLEKIPFIWEKLSFTSKITLRNIFRYKSRFFMTIVGVAGCTSLILLGFGIRDSISSILDIQYKDIFRYNVEVSFDNEDHLEENLEILKSDKHNEIALPLMSYRSKIYLEEDEGVINAKVYDSKVIYETMNLRSKDKKTPIDLKNDGVIISEKFSKLHKIKKGDVITIESINGYKAQAKVAQIAEMYFDHYMFVSDVLYENLFNEKIHNNTIALKTDDVEDLKDKCERLSDFSALADFETVISQFEIMLKALDLIILLITLTAGSLAFVVLVNLSSINISERTREIATLKVLGFRYGEVNSYVFREIILLSVIGSLTGLPLGVLEHHGIMNIINIELIMYGMKIKTVSYVFAFAITLGFTIIIMLFMTRVLKKVDMVESLKSVE